MDMKTSTDENRPFFLIILFEGNTEWGMSYACCKLVGPILNIFLNFEYFPMFSISLGCFLVRSNFLKMALIVGKWYWYLKISGHWIMLKLWGKWLGQGPLPWREGKYYSYKLLDRRRRCPWSVRQSVSQSVSPLLRSFYQNWIIGPFWFFAIKVKKWRSQIFREKSGSSKF